MNKIIENRIVKCDIGSVVTLESGRTERLLPSDWDRCEFRFPNPIQGWEIKHAIAINVKITGRTFQWMGSEYWVKVQIEWVGDGGATIDGRPVYRDWMSGTVIGVELDGSYLVRRVVGGTCLVTTDVLAREYA